MTGKQLKNSILQWAIQGKLVPQDPNDEPASVLLEKIRAEKARLVKEGKLKKKDLEVKPIAEDEIPFEIPKGWEWCRLNDCLDVRDGTHDTPKYVSSGYPLVTSKNLRNGAIDFKGALLISKEDHEAISFRSRVDENDVLFAMIGSIGNPVLVRHKETDFSIKNMALFKHVKDFVSMDYVYWFLCFAQVDMKEYASGGVQSFVSLGYLRNYCIPLPPLAEQHRIVAKIEELMPLVEKYGTAQDTLDEWNNALPEKLKKSILQEAIQGKLVPQDPADEAAEITLNKYGYVLPKKASKGKEFSQELFDIPDTWTWAPFKKCAEVLYGYPFDSQKFSEVKMGMPMIRIRDVLPGITKTYTTEKADERYIIRKGDMLVGMDGNFNVNYWNSIDAYLNQRVCKVVANEQVVLQKYLYYYLPIVFEEISSNVSYCTVKHLADTHFNLMRIPLPPLAEQRRIVAKIEELFGVINK